MDRKEIKSLYISGYDKAGIFRFSIPNGEKIPSGVIAGKGWVLKIEYRETYKCPLCGAYTNKDYCEFC